MLGEFDKGYHGLNDNFITNFITIIVLGGGGGGSELTDRQGCAILALELVPKNLIFT